MQQCTIRKKKSSRLYELGYCRYRDQYGRIYDDRSRSTANVPVMQPPPEVSKPQRPAHDATQETADLLRAS